MSWTIAIGDCITILRELEAESVDTCITSPPYWGLRDYGVDGQIGLEKSPDEFVDKMVEVFEEVRRVLKPQGTLWLNLGDCYASSGGAGWQGKHGARADRTHTQRSLKRRSALEGLKPKDLVGIPWAVAFALRASGWYLRSDIIWAKPNPMPESVTDRPTKSHEYIFLFAKSDRYFYDSDAIKEPAVTAEEVKWAGEQSGLNSAESWAGTGKSTRRFGKAGNKVRTPASERGIPGAPEGATTGVVASGVPWQGITRNKRTVWTVITQPFAGAHFATFPPKLIEPCILAGSVRGGSCLIHSLEPARRDSYRSDTAAASSGSS
jgi:hypothetical protein